MTGIEAIPLLTERLVAAFDPERIILFGSYAWGTPSSASDVDLCVVVKSSDERAGDRIVRARKATQDITFPKDIIVKTESELAYYADVLPALESKIIRKGHVVYVRT